MIWASWSDFLAMGGYGLYVWGSYGVTLGALGIDIMAGFQLGQEKAFYYAGIGIAGWD